MFTEMYYNNIITLLSKIAIISQADFRVYREKMAFSENNAKQGATCPKLSSGEHCHGSKAKIKDFINVPAHIKKPDFIENPDK